MMQNMEAVRKALAALEPESLQETDYAARGYHLVVKVSPARIVEAAEALDELGFFLEAITGVDWLGEKEALKKAREKERAAAAKKAAEAAAAEGETAGAASSEEPSAPDADEPVDGNPVDDLEAVYDFNNYRELLRVSIHVRTPRDNPEIPSISGVFPGANWHERETHDFFGIRFAGHPDLSPLLLPEDADFHPLLKDFQV